jgi:membrane-bound lytic murein transglycosylase D
MQYKNIVSAFLFTIIAFTVGAQPASQAPKVVAQNTKNDTVVAHTGKQALTPSGSLLASNLAAPASAEVKDGEKGYRHVPLAGEKSYFGEKNDYMNNFVRKYMEINSRTLSVVKSNSEKPFSVIDNVLEKKNLPKELKYLAVIESALNNKAVSHAGAVGPWQLMSTTAKMMGLSVTRKNDDRTDIYKSTAAATKYLELLYSQLNDWLLVIAAYNSGPTPVQRAIDRTGSRNFWDIKEYLPRETQGHVLAFIATASIFENLSKFINLGSIPVDFKFGKEEEAIAIAAGKAVASGPVVVAKKSPYTDEELKNMAIVRITSPLYMEFMVQELGVDKKLLARWNPDYDAYVFGSNYPTPFYNLHLPKDKLDVFLQKKEMLTKKSKIMLAQLK